MKFLIWNDMEGPSGIDNANMFEENNYSRTRELATYDVNAAIRGIRRVTPEAGIEIFDGHGKGGNLIEEKLEPNCEILGGGWMTTFYKMVKSSEVSKYDGVFLLGQHACEGTRNGFMSHTNTGVTALRVNGRFVGEVPQLAWLFGHFGVPIMLVVGDDAVSRETKVILSGIETVVVKKGIDTKTAECIPLDDAHEMIENSSSRVTEVVDQLMPQKVTTPVEIETFFAFERMAESASKFPNVERTGKSSVKYVAQDFLEGWLAYNTARVVVNEYIFNDILVRVRNLEDVKEALKKFKTEFNERKEHSQVFPPVTY